MNKNYFNLAIILLLVVSVKSLAFYADQIPPKIVHSSESELNHSVWLPEEIQGQWLLDEKASVEYANKQEAFQKQQEEMLTSLLLANSTMRYIFTKNRLIVRHKNDEVVFEASLVEKEENHWKIELNHKGYVTPAWLSLSIDHKLNIQGQHFFGHQFILWQKTSKSEVSVASTQKL